MQSQSVSQMFEAIDMNYMLDLERHFSEQDVTQVRNKIMSNCVYEWQVYLNRQEAKPGPGKNELHTYWVLKQEYATDLYEMQKYNVF